MSSLRHQFASGLLVATMLLALSPISLTSAVLQDPPLSPDLGPDAPSKVAVTPLASETADDLVSHDLRTVLSLLLARVPIDPGERIDMRDWDQTQAFHLGSPDQYLAAGAHLLYVEGGQLELDVTDGSSVSLQPGDQAFQESGSQYALRNTSDECASILVSRAVTFPSGAAGGAFAPTEIPNLPVDCGKPTVLGSMHWEPAQFWEPPLLFVAETTWEPGTFTSRVATPGPLALWVESGELGVIPYGKRNAHGIPPVTMHIRDGGVSLEPHQAYSIRTSGEEPSTALFFGAIPTDEPLWIPPQFEGVTYPYRVDLEGWRIRQHYRDHGINLQDYERLSVQEPVNETVWVDIETFSSPAFTDIEEQPFQGDPETCIDDAASTLRSITGVSDVRWALVLDTGIRRIDPSIGTSRLFRYTYTDAAGVSVDRLAYFECQRLRRFREDFAFQPMLRTSAFMNADEADASMDEVNGLLTTLSVPPFEH